MWTNEGREGSGVIEEKAHRPNRLPDKQQRETIVICCRLLFNGRISGNLVSTHVSRDSRDRSDLTFNSATVSVNVRPNDNESVHHCRIQDLHALDPDPETCAGCANSQKSKGLSSSQSTRMSPKCFLYFISYSRAAFLTLRSRGSSLERISPPPPMVSPTLKSMGRIVESLRDTDNSSPTASSSFL
ncbi:hypothetical protein EVAR_28541_1 [Eumeta japonica]|uniref:Uncharacterized protein n=1 Tax=Eumeta variegata TaxID=151549 RepID=A0A4C1UY73_EUMVA|nr:hypothetical protein EVAR_28541_1 [Eumeta japonica]